MSQSNISVILGSLVLLLSVSEAWAGRRSPRIEFEAWDEGVAIASCPEATSVGAVFTSMGYFSGDSGTTFLVDAYCQNAFNYNDGSLPPFEERTELFEYLNSTTVPEDEPGLAAKIGDNDSVVPGNFVTAVRYTFLDQDRFSDDPFPEGFQWAFYKFPGNITIVGLYGLEAVSLNSANHFIESGGKIVWDGERDGFDGEYFCFDGNEFIGFWDGGVIGGGPEAGCELPPGPEEIFLDSFEVCDVSNPIFCPVEED